MPTLDRPVGASSDDCSRIKGTIDNFSLTAAFCGVGWADGLDYHMMGHGLRFTNITIPQGSTITSAYIIYTARNSDSTTTCYGRISAEDVDNAATFADDKAAFDTRFNAHTTARVDWDNIEAFVYNAEHQTPEIKDVIQEIVDRNGWASGNAIVLFVEDFDDRTTNQEAERYGQAWDTDSAKASKLHIEYTLPPQTILPSAIVSLEAFGSPTVILVGNYIYPSAIASLEAFGSPTVLPGAVTIQPSAIQSAEALGSPQLNLKLFAQGIPSAEAFGTPLVIPGAVIIQPSGIASLEAFGTPLVFYDQVIIPTGIASAEAFGTPTLTFNLFIKPQGIPSAEAFGALKVLREIIHIILDGQYTQGSPGVNRIYVIGKDAEGNPVYGTSLNQAEIDLVGERLDFTQDLSIPTDAKAADVAAAAVAKARLTGSRGFIVIPPNCGQELWDVVQVTDKPTAQSQQKYRVIAVSFDYEPRRARYQHKLILGAP